MRTRRTSQRLSNLDQGTTKEISTIVQHTLTLILDGERVAQGGHMSHMNV